MPWYEALTILMRENRPVRRKVWAKGEMVEILKGMSDMYMGLTVPKKEFQIGWRPNHEELWASDWETI